MLVKFYYKAVEKGEGPDGLPMFEDEIWVTIARDMTHTVDAKATEDHISRFRDLYEAFLRSVEDHEKVEGYPLEMWAALTPAQVESFKIRGYRSVQDLVAADQRKMPPEFKVLAKRAREFVALAGAGKGLTAEAEKLASDNELLREENNELKGRLHKLTKQLEEA